MESLDRSKAVIEIGKRIVADLKLGDDVTAQWMAHLIAEKISAAEDAPETARDTAVAECVDMIQKLWAHRYTLPPYMRPLRELDPLLRTLTSLGVDEMDEFRFFSRPPSSEELEGATEEEKELFEFAIGIDHAARELIRYALGVAAERSINVVKPWLEESVKGGLEATVELRVSRFAEDCLLKSQKETNSQVMLDRAVRLESFAKAALFLASEMREMLPHDITKSDD
ncbi:AVAST type 3 anti-phage proein Avs3b [Salinicola sp. RZ23]|uniref:AVAST type 3 anti-phage proein Avs3b n=1 Tax=Salinicola sp. RZ23 TaxID=1949087 RepID=UPI000DA19F8D|nr:AVAST type 3 anti-phage proein Avs3b [Salinicola sp. RZ23]